jgi:hypothetical protein
VTLMFSVGLFGSSLSHNLLKCDLIFLWVRGAHLLIFLCGVFGFVCSRSVSCAKCCSYLSELSILDCSFSCCIVQNVSNKARHGFNNFIGNIPFFLDRFFIAFNRIFPTLVQ